MMKLNCIPIICLLAIILTISSVYGAPSSNRTSHVEIPDNANITGSGYTISAFSPKIFVRTSQFDLNFESCVQFKFKLSETRVKLRAYTCQLSEGGYCVLDKFAFPRQKEGCSYLRPWTRTDDSFSFYFVLERRARKYRPGKRRHVSKRTISNKPFANFEIDGIMPCNEVCDGLLDKKKRNQIPK
ncbi:unnamed protein product [Auanema sp. JU1783]|nr:unnamed protein product [Auanema sp. JU1783]